MKHSGVRACFMGLYDCLLVYVLVLPRVPPEKLGNHLRGLVTTGFSYHSLAQNNKCFDTEQGCHFPSSFLGGIPPFLQ